MKEKPGAGVRRPSLLLSGRSTTKWSASQPILSKDDTRFYPFCKFATLRNDERDSNAKRLEDTEAIDLGQEERDPREGP